MRLREIKHPVSDHTASQRYIHYSFLQSQRVLFLKINPSHKGKMVPTRSTEKRENAGRRQIVSESQKTGRSTGGIKMSPAPWLRQTGRPF